MPDKTYGECTDLELLRGALENLHYLHRISKRPDEENLYTFSDGSQTVDWRDIAHTQTWTALTVLQIRLEEREGK